MDEDLAGPRGHEILERGVDRIGVPIAALDAVGAKQAADHLGLGLSGDDGQDDGLLFFHGRDATRYPPTMQPGPYGPDAGLGGCGALCPVTIAITETFSSVPTM